MTTADLEARPARAGIGKALLSAALFGVSAPLAKGLLTGAPPQLLAGLLYLGSGAGLALLWLARRARTQARRGAAERPLGRADLPWLAGATLCGGLLAPLLLLLGLTRTAASTAALLLNLEAVATALLAWTLFDEHAHRRIVAGMGLIVVGGIVLSWEGRAGWRGLGGPLAIAGACLCWGIDNNLTQHISAGDPLQVASLKGAVAGTVNLVIALALGGSAGAGAVAGALALGFFSYGLSLVLFILALRELGTARTGAYFSTAPFIGAAAAVLIRGEPLTRALLTGGALMAAGVWLCIGERHAHQHVHEATTHSHRHVHDQHHRHEHAPGTPPGEPHVHEHTHAAIAHAHPHYPDIHHRHGHS